METVICPKCQTEKPHTKEFFKWNFRKAQSKEYLEKICKACRQYKANLRARERMLTDENFKKKKLEAVEKNRLRHQEAKDEAYLKRRARCKQWQQENKERIRERDKGRHAKRYANTTYKLSKLFGNRVRAMLEENDNWRTMLGYSIGELKEHLEKHFALGMTWENHGRGENCWHIDHIKPVSWFNFASVEDEEFKKCWALENLVPKWEKDNLSKGNRFIG
jgi:hypothetical protein